MENLTLESSVIELKESGTIDSFIEFDVDCLFSHVVIRGSSGIYIGRWKDSPDVFLAPSHYKDKSIPWDGELNSAYVPIENLEEAVELLFTSIAKGESI